MLFFSIFLSGFTLGIFAALKIFAPENREETWDPQHFPVKYSPKTQDLVSHIKKPVTTTVHLQSKHVSHLASVK